MMIIGVNFVSVSTMMKNCVGIKEEKVRKRKHCYIIMSKTVAKHYIVLYFILGYYFCLFVWMDGWMINEKINHHHNHNHHCHNHQVFIYIEK